MRNNDIYPGITSRPEIEKLQEEIVTDYIETKPKGTIYHYTDVSGLLGIVQNKNIWNAGAIWQTFEAMKEVNRPEGDEAWQFYDSSIEIAWKTGTSRSRSWSAFR